jgi:hypothetical protein
MSARKPIDAVIGAAFVSAALWSGAAMAQGPTTQIDASISYLFNRLRPNPTPNIPVTHSYRIILSGANQVDEQRTAQSGALSSSSHLTRLLGQTSSEGKTGGAWRVAGPASLERRRNLPQSVETLTIRIHGQGCEIGVSNQLKPGFSEFMYPRIGTGEWQYFSEPQVTGSSCVIK